ncbi:hypothetical protein GCM10010289_72880 [Streptomyces violascens]|nr:hypothetical protein GCM10010289_72880 [Streptomyces violascens]
MELTVDSFIAVVVLNGYALAAFACGRLTVRAVHRAPRWVYFLAPPVLTAAAGRGGVVAGVAVLLREPRPPALVGRRTPRRHHRLDVPGPRRGQLQRAS